MRNPNSLTELKDILGLCSEDHYGLVNLDHLGAETFLPPGETSFDALLALLSNIPEHETEQALIESQRKLQTYPATARRLDTRARHLPLQFQSPGWPLVRNLVIYCDNSDEIRRFITHPEMGQIEGLCLKGEKLDVDALNAIVSSPHLRQLFRLEIQCPMTGKAQEILRAEQLFGRLREIRPLEVEDLQSVPSFGVEKVFCKGTPDHIRLLSERCPRLTDLELFGIDQEMMLSTIDALVSNPDLAARLRCLTVGHGITDSAMERLISCRFFSNLQKIKLGNAISLRELSGFEKCPFFPQLEELDLSDNPVYSEGWEMLSRCPLDNLKKINLSSTAGSDEGALALAASSSLSNLSHFESSRCGIGVKGITGLIGSSLLSGVAHLDLMENALSEAGVSTLVFSPNIQTLRSLSLSLSEGEEFIAIENSPYLTQLESLYLSSTENSNAAQTLSLPKSSNILRLTLATNLDDHSAEVLAQCEHLRNLRSLRLIGGMQMSGVGGRRIFQSPHLAKLWELSLNLCQIGDEGAKGLAESTSITRLHHLELIGCGITEIGSTALANSANMTRLRDLVMPDSLLSPWIHSTTISPILRDNLEAMYQGRNSPSS